MATQLLSPGCHSSVLPEQCGAGGGGGGGGGWPAGEQPLSSAGSQSALKASRGAHFITALTEGATWLIMTHIGSTDSCLFMDCRHLLCVYLVVFWSLETGGHDGGENIASGCLIDIDTGETALWLTAKISAILNHGQPPVCIILWHAASQWKWQGHIDACPFPQSCLHAHVAAGAEYRGSFYFISLVLYVKCIACIQLQECTSFVWKNLYMIYNLY